MSRRILVVDDSPTIRNLVSYILKNQGLSVDTAEDGQVGLELLAQGQYHAIVLDINMPNVDGFEFLKRVRNDPNNKTIPIVMLTTEGQEEDKTRAMDLGASRFLVKPFKPSELMEVLETILGGRA